MTSSCNSDASALRIRAYTNVQKDPRQTDVTEMVGLNDFGGGLRLGAHLAALGHRRIAFLGPDTPMAHTRLAGIRTGLENACSALAAPFDRAQLTPVVVLLPGHGGQEPEFVDQLLAGETNPAAIRRRFTAIACCNDWLAVHAVKYLNALKTKDLGLRIASEPYVRG